MSPLVRLGLRLAGGGGAHERARTGSVVLACTIGIWVLLNTFAIAGAEQGRLALSAEGQRVLVAVVLVVTMPTLVLIATATRLSATLRDRRLAGLRLLGLSPGATRVVAAVESGVAAVVGTLLGALAFVAGRPVLSDLQVAGRDWSQTSFSPSLGASVAVMLAVPLAAISVSLLPTRRLGRDVLAQTRVATSRPPSPLLLLPLTVGGSVCLLAARNAPREITDTRAYVFFGGAVLCGLGLLLVVPVFVRLIAGLLVRVPGRPTMRLAGRRLQAQPAAVARIVSGLLIGLFLVSGARAVVGAFEATPQYISAERAMKEGPATYSVTPPSGVDQASVLRTLESVTGVRAAVPSRLVATGCGRSDICEEAFVGTCAELVTLVPSATGCRDDQMLWLSSSPDRYPAELTWRATQGRAFDSVTLPAPGREEVIRVEGDGNAVTDQAGAFIPLATPGIKALAERRSGVIVLADPGADVEQGVVEALAPWGSGTSIHATFAIEDYDFVVGLRAMVWAVAAVVLSVGLLAFAISAIDRAVSRRAEMVSLQLLGTPRSVIRAAQWLEALLPLAIGLPGAVLLGWAVGSGYLALGGALDANPWQSTLALGVLATAAAVFIAGLTVIASAPRVRADLIRRV